MPGSRLYSPSGAVTPANPNPEEIQTIDFTFSSGILPIFTIAAGAKIIKAEIHLTTAFNGVGATLKIGDATLDDRLMGAAQNDLFSLDTYESSVNYKYLLATMINLTVNAGTATQGSGYIAIIYNLNN